MIIQIDPLDTLIFRDGRPFGSDNDSWANSLVFPSLTSIYGGLRATYFAQNPEQIGFANTIDDPTKNLIVKNVFFKTKNIPLFQISKDLVMKDKKEKNVYSLTLKENSNTSSNLQMIFESDFDNVANANGFLSKSNFKRYLNGDKKVQFKPLDEFILSESKIGIGRNNNTKSVDDGKLYRIGLNRYNELKIIIDFEGMEIKDEGLMRFGGEGKGAYYKKIDDIELPKCEQIENDVFKLVLLTPAIFKKGWLPDFINDNNFEGEFEEIKLKLIAAAVGKSEYIGGWDIKENKPKSMFKAVPAGSVYYFELQNPLDKEKVIEIFNYKSIVDMENYKKEGYGICVVGNYKKDTK